jgi:hypothetical protein
MLDGSFYQKPMWVRVLASPNSFMYMHGDAEKPVHVGNAELAHGPY